MFKICALLGAVLCANAINYGLPPSYGVFFGNPFSGVTKNLFESTLPTAPSIGFSSGSPGYSSFSSSGFAPSAGPYGPQTFGGQGQGQGQAPQQPQDPSQQGCGQAPAFCPKNRYRSYDGTCNNLRNPILGTPNTPYNRLLPPKYGDGKLSPTLFWTFLLILFCVQVLAHQQWL